MKLEFTEKELREMSPEDRKVLFKGRDPLEEEGFRFSGISVGMAFAIAIALILIAYLVIEFIFQPTIAPPLEPTRFEIPLPEDHPLLEADVYFVAESFWNQAQYERFITASERLRAQESLQDHTEAVKELYLFEVKAMFFLGEYERGREFARFIQSRHPDDNQFMSDVYYVRGHITLHKDGHREALGAFREAYILNGRYADEAEQAMNTITRITRPIW